MQEDEEGVEVLLWLLEADEVYSGVTEQVHVYSAAAAAMFLLAASKWVI
jgi:hypothetical protein